MLSRGKLTRLPNSPGVYFFLSSPKHSKGGKPGSKILYIGKATDLRSRVRSYFSSDLIEARGPKLVKMLSEATSVDYKQTDSVLEALILESALIKKHLPKYNSDLKDDKSFNYVVITKEDFPRVLILRGTNLATPPAGSRAGITYDLASTFGPFPHGTELREALKIIRKIFPYRDKCLPHYPRGLTPGKPCFNAQIGLCPGVCSGAISKSEYAKVVRSIKLFFEGKKSEIIQGLRKHMKLEAGKRNFEKAGELRNKIFALTHINDIALWKRRKLDSGVTGMRIEAYDVAHLSGTNTVGVMAVLTDGLPDKAEYRKFKIRTRTNDDPGSLRELLTRRIKHTEWTTPDIVVIDGGPAQRAVGEKIFDNLEVNDPSEVKSEASVKIVNVIKNDKHKPERIVGDSAIVRDYHHEILLANSEAHRFAIAYHRQLRQLKTQSSKRKVS